MSGLFGKEEKENHKDIIRRLPMKRLKIEQDVFTGESSRAKEQAVRKIKIEFVAEEKLAEKIERSKEILRHKFPEGKFEDIFNQALDDLLEKRDPNKKIERIKKRKAIRSAVNFFLIVFIDETACLC